MFVKALLTCVVAGLVHCCFAQTPQRIDSLIALLPGMKEDTAKVRLLSRLSPFYSGSNHAEAIKYGTQAVALARKTDWTSGITESLNSLGFSYKAAGNFEKALECYDRRPEEERASF